MWYFEECYVGGRCCTLKWCGTLKRVVLYFDSFLQAGARIHSDSWGSETIDTTYTTEAADFDLFSWQQRDMLVLLAAGYVLIIL